MLFYEWRKFGNLETIKLRQMLSPRSSWPLRFNSSDIRRPISTQDFEFTTKINSHQIINLLKGRLSPVWEYARCCNDYRTGRTSWVINRLLWTVQVPRYSRPTVIWFPFFAFFSMKSYSLQIPYILTFLNSNTLWRNRICIYYFRQRFSFHFRLYDLS